MIKVTECESMTLEGIKKGMKVSDIANMLGLRQESVRNQCRQLLKKKLIDSTRIKGSCYSYNGTPYIVDPTANNKRVKLAYDPREDQLLNSAMNFTLDDDNRFYLENHKEKWPRKVLCQRTGLTRLQLNFILERLG